MCVYPMLREGMYPAGGGSGILCEPNVTDCLCQETCARGHNTRWQKDVCPSVTKTTVTQPGLCQGLALPCVCEELCLMMWPQQGVYVGSLRMWACVFVQKTSACLVSAHIVSLC